MSLLCSFKHNWLVIRESVLETPDYVWVLTLTDDEVKQIGELPPNEYSQRRRIIVSGHYADRICRRCEKIELGSKKALQRIFNKIEREQKRIKLKNEAEEKDERLKEKFNKFRKMAAIASLSLLFTLSGCDSIRPSWRRELTEEEKKELNLDGPANGHFEGSEWIPDNSQVVATYALPDISTGIYFDVKALKVTPTIHVEILEIETHIPYLETVVIDGMVGYQRAGFYAGKLLTNLFEVSLGGAIAWNFEDRELSYGVCGTIIRF
jgi:hypothetical protein